MIVLDIAVEHAGWAAEPGLTDLLRQAADAAIRTAPDAPPGELTATLLLAGDAEIRELNRAWRGQDKPTNVLSFPAPALPPASPSFRGGEAEPGTHDRAPEPERGFRVLASGEPRNDGGRAQPGTPRELGDVALAYETVAREAEAEGKTIRDHAAHLVVHGILHLLGADHDDDADAELMERAEVAALATLGIADPYRDTVAS